MHGDGFDSVSTNHKWLASLGAVGYDFLLKVNRVYNRYRAWRGKEYFSLSKRVKAKVKSAVSFVDHYEELLQDLARHKKCDGIICGHIHTPEDKQVGGDPLPQLRRLGGEPDRHHRAPRRADGAGAI